MVRMTYESYRMKVADNNSELNLDQIEFNALPSGLHLIQQDVV